jgi:EAL and modified HD-GYP domain-containing signal transduction protein
MALPKERVVLEVSRDTAQDEALLQSLTALNKAGYKLAVAGFDYDESSRPLLDIAHYASLNFDTVPLPEIHKQLAVVRQCAAKPIASRLATHDDFEAAKALQFEYFRGTCFMKPKLASPARVPINRLSTLQLVLKLQQPDLKASELEKVVSQDLAITYKLLQYLNSAAFSLARNIESVGHAVRMVGTDRIRVWASMLLLSKLDDKPPELIVTAFLRAKMAEALALAIGATNPDSYYMVGLFSLVDALLNVPLPDAIQLLPFSKEVREAIMRQEGSMGAVLKCVLAYENGSWDEVRCGNLDPATIRQCYLDAISAARHLPKYGKGR